MLLIHHECTGLRFPLSPAFRLSPFFKGTDRGNTEKTGEMKIADVGQGPLQICKGRGVCLCCLGP